MKFVIKGLTIEPVSVEVSDHIVNLMESPEFELAFWKEFWKAVSSKIDADVARDFDPEGT